MTKSKTPRLEFLTVEHAGDLANEVLVLEATADIADLHDFIVMDSTYDDSEILTNVHRHVFWLPQETPLHGANEGDVVKIHTKIGDDDIFEGKNGNIHHFYMNLKQPIWNEDGDIVTVLEVSAAHSEHVNQEPIAARVAAAWVARSGE